MDIAVALGYGQNANMVSALALHDLIMSSRDNYNRTFARLSHGLAQLNPNP